MVAWASACGKCHLGVANENYLRTAPTSVQVVLCEQGATGVTGADSPTVRRRELGALLRALRAEAGMTVEQVAERLLVSSSKIAGSRPVGVGPTRVTSGTSATSMASLIPRGASI